MVNPIKYSSKQSYLEIMLELSEKQIVHTRRSYSVLDMFGELGGVKEVLVIIITVSLSSWAEFRFNLKAIQRLFAVRTKQPNVFNDSLKWTRKKTKLSSRLTTHSD